MTSCRRLGWVCGLTLLLAIGLATPCSSSNPAKPLQTLHSRRLHLLGPQSGSAEPCEACEEAVGSLVDKAHVLAGALVERCGVLPQAELCATLVKKLFPHGIEYVKQQPTAACSLVGMCGGHAGTGSGAMQEAEASMKQPLVGTRGVADASPCDQCKMTVLEIRMVINNPTMQSEITNVTRSLCDRVPPYEVQCRQYVDTYAPVVFQEIDKYFQPDSVCQLLQMCPARHTLMAYMSLWLEQRGLWLAGIMGGGGATQ